MQLEHRYIVFKISDLGNSIKGDEVRRLADEYAEQRAKLGKAPLKGIFVEEDWPEFGPVFRMLEQRVDGATVVTAPARKHSHYFKDVSHLKDIDVYRVLKLFNVTDPCVQHAVKKLLVAGGRGAGKGIERDLREAVDSINRALQMIAEDDVPGSSRDSLQP